MGSLVTVTNDGERFEEEVQFQESWLRYTAAMPARDDAERDLYRDWAERDDWTPRAVMYGSASELRGKTHDELRELARHEAAIALLTGSPEDDPNTGARRSPSGEGRDGAGVPAMARFSRLRDWHAQRAGRRDLTWQARDRGPAEGELRAGLGREPRPITDFVWTVDPGNAEADTPAVKADPGEWGKPLAEAGVDAEHAAYKTDVRSESEAALSAAQRAELIADREAIAEDSQLWRRYTQGEEPANDAETQRFEAFRRQDQEQAAYREERDAFRRYAAGQAPRGAAERLRFARSGRELRDADFEAGS